MNYYEILEVSPNASQEIIKIAYKNLAKKYHPDTSNQENAAEIMQKINEAYEVLSDPERRTEYDEDLKNNSNFEPITNCGNDVKNIKEILSKVARVYPDIIDNNDIHFNRDYDINTNLSLNKKYKDYITVPQDSKIYILYTGTNITMEKTYHNIMAICETGIYAFAESSDFFQKVISWNEFLKHGVRKDAGEILIGSYCFRCVDAPAMYEILNEIFTLMQTGYSIKSHEEERKEIVNKKIKYNLVSNLIYIGLVALFYFKGWNNWIIKIIDALLIGGLSVFIKELVLLYIDDKRLKLIVKWTIYSLGALIWYKITK